MASPALMSAIFAVPSPDMSSTAVRKNVKISTDIPNGKREALTVLNSLMFVFCLFIFFCAALL